ncbi:MAG: signal recognition particle protein Srp19, partial [Candidatus Aerophobus sp.]
NTLPRRKTFPPKIKMGQRNIFMLVGIQGSGKTTTAVKMAKYFQKKGFKTALICADTFRPGAHAQLLQLAKRANVPLYGEPKARDPVKIVLNGLKKFEDYNILLIDTTGRHKDEKDLIKEMRMLERTIKPDEVILVIDGTIGQQAADQAKAFHEATHIGSVFVAKLDGSARGGGALSVVAAIGAPIRFIGTGEKIGDLELFTPSRLVGRILGMGDLDSLIEKVREAEATLPEKKLRMFVSGRFTLMDMYEQFEALKSMGPFRRILQMIPGLSYNVPEELMGVAEDRFKRWRVIIQSMTPEERITPKILNSSRIRRVAQGSGTSEKEVKELLKAYSMMRKMFKTFRRKRFTPFLGKGLSMGRLKDLL